jgi:hypothetical protein
LHENILAWQGHPARERPGATLGAAAIIVAAGAAAWFSFGPAWGVAAVIVLVAALNRFFFPSRFVIDEEGITARYPLRRQRLCWAELRRFVHDEHGGFLSTRVRSSRLDAYSGMHLLFGTHRDAIVEQIRARLNRGESGNLPAPAAQPLAHAAGGRPCRG